MSPKVWVEDTEFGEDFEVSVNPADLISAVRRGVESGTIKGEMKRWCEAHQAESIENHGGMSDECWRVVWADHRAYEGLPLTGYGLCRIVQLLVIPVSDGGEDRP